jgi:hypothetical protein
MHFYDYLPPFSFPRPQNNARPGAQVGRTAAAAMSVLFKTEFPLTEFYSSKRGRSYGHDQQ